MVYAIGALFLYLEICNFLNNRCRQTIRNMSRDKIFNYVPH